MTPLDTRMKSVCGCGWRQVMPSVVPADRQKGHGRRQRSTKPCRWEFKRCTHREQRFLFSVLSETKRASWMLGGLLVQSPKLGGPKFWSCPAYSREGSRKTEAVWSFSSSPSSATEGFYLGVREPKTEFQVLPACREPHTCVQSMALFFQRWSGLAATNRTLEERGSEN